MKKLSLLSFLLASCVSTEPENPTIEPVTVNTKNPMATLQPTTTQPVSSLTGDVDAKTAEEFTRKWLEAVPGGKLEMTIVDSAPRGMVPYCFFNSSLTCNEERSDSLFIYDNGPKYINIGFREVVTPKTTTKEAQAALNFVALNRIPPDTLRISGWEIMPVTPVSSFKDGVEIISLQDKKITYRVNTELFAMYGYKRTPECKAMADAPTPKGCMFAIKQAIPLELTVSLPMFQERVR